MAAPKELRKCICDLGASLSELSLKGPAHLSTLKGIKKFCAKKRAYDSLIALGPANDLQTLELYLDQSIPFNLLVVSSYAARLAFPSKDSNALTGFTTSILDTWTSGISLLQCIIATINDKDFSTSSVPQAEELLEQLECKTAAKEPPGMNNPCDPLAHCTRMSRPRWLV